MKPISWIAIVRLGLVQTALGAVVVLTTSTLNRVMVVELGLPAILPGLLVALHYAVQVMRPRLGYGSDIGGRCTPWIVGGMAVLACGGALSAIATAWMATSTVAGVVLAVLSFALIGLGVGAAGTSLLVLLAKRVDAARKPAAATTVWLMMIAGFVVTASVAGRLLDPFSLARLVQVTSVVSIIAFVVAAVAVWGIEGKRLDARAADQDKRAGNPGVASPHVVNARADKPRFRQAFTEVWGEPAARRFTIFVFVSMLAYSAQDLILEPFAGTVFKLAPGESTSLSGLQHGGVLCGMLLVAAAGSVFARSWLGSMRTWCIGGCVASAIALLSLSLAGFVGPAWPLRASVFALGASNGAFSIAAIGSMMALSGTGRESREGVRMGLWGAAQAIAFGLGGFAGTVASDVARWLLGSPGLAYACVFAAEAALFVYSARLAGNIGHPRSPRRAAARGPYVAATDPQ